VPSSAQKKSAPLNSVRRLGLEAAALGFTSFTSFVPAAVLSLFQSSRPLVASSALK
jgi:hypothetical protein